MFKKAVKPSLEERSVLRRCMLWVIWHIRPDRKSPEKRHRYHAMRKANEKAREKVVLPLNEQEKTMTVVPSEIDPIFLPKKKQSKLGLLFGAKKIFGDHKSVIGNLIQNPEEHRFEAFVEGDELQIHVKRKGGFVISASSIMVRRGE